MVFAWDEKTGHKVFTFDATDVDNFMRVMKQFQISGDIDSNEFYKQKSLDL